MKLYTIILATLILLWSCSENKTQEGLSKLFQTTINVKTVSCASVHGNDLLNPRMLAIDSANFYFYDKGADSMLVVIDKQNGHKKHFLAKGQGPKDAISIESLSAANNNVYIYNSSLQKVLYYNTATSCINIDTALSSTITNKVLSTSFAFDSALTIFPILNDDNRFIIKTQDKEVAFGKIDPTDEYSSINYGWLLQPVINVSPPQKRVFWGSGVGNAYGIYDYSDLNNIKPICSQLYEMPITDETLDFTSETQMGILSVTSSNDFVFALFSGKLIGSILRNLIDQDKLTLANNILVFDWEGNPIKRIVVDHELRDIYYDKYNNKLYGIELNGEYSLCSIPLEL